MDHTTASERDARHLLRAVELAAEARGSTSPNPLVGAVIVKGGRTIGEGFHAAPGEHHAERAALAACHEDPAGATMYVSLEPCCHHGRTPPCTDAILEASITRVVVASDDPTPKAAGRGLGILRDEGVSTDLYAGEVAAAARLLNQPFRKHARTGRPLVILKSAMTLDGKVATSTGHSKWISGESSRARAHRWRAEATRWPWASVPPWSTTRCSPPGWRPSATSRRAWSSTRKRGCRWRASWCAPSTRAR